MNPYEIEFGTHQFWSDLRSRLIPFLGDVEQTLGSNWMDDIEDAFGRADFWAVASAKQNPNGHDWYLLRLFPAAESIMTNDWVAATHSREHAVALLAGQCTEIGCWPDEVNYFPEQDRIEVKLNGGMFAEITPIPRSSCADSALRSRVESTVQGLRKGRGYRDELARRISRWPGMRDVGLLEESRESGLTHLPEPAEWLISARMLAEKAGLAPLSTSDAQSLAATVLGETSWNHLCGHFQKWREHHAVSSHICPWVVRLTDDADDYGDIQVFYDFDEAFIDFVTKSREAVASAPTGNWTINPSKELSRLPVLHLVRPKRGPGKHDAWLGRDLWVDRVSVCLYPVEVGLAEDVWVGRVLAALQSGIARGVSEVLQVELPADNRLVFRSAELQRNVVAVDGGWHFSVDQDGEETSRHLYASLRDKDGNLLWEAGAPLYKGTLHWNARLGAHVLGSDYDGRVPTAVIRGISKATAGRVSTWFTDRPSPMLDIRDHDLEYRNELDSLDARIQDRIARAGK